MRQKIADFTAGLEAISFYSSDAIVKRRSMGKYSITAARCDLSRNRNFIVDLMEINEEVLLLLDHFAMA